MLLSAPARLQTLQTWRSPCSHPAMEPFLPTQSPSHTFPSRANHAFESNRQHGPNQSSPSAAENKTTTIPTTSLTSLFLSSIHLSCFAAHSINRLLEARLGGSDWHSCYCSSVLHSVCARLSIVLPRSHLLLVSWPSPSWRFEAAISTRPLKADDHLSILRILAQISSGPTHKASITT